MKIFLFVRCFSHVQLLIWRVRKFKKANDLFFYGCLSTAVKVDDSGDLQSLISLGYCLERSACPLPCAEATFIWRTSSKSVPRPGCRPQRLVLLKFAENNGFEGREPKAVLHPNDERFCLVCPLGVAFCTCASLRVCLTLDIAMVTTEESQTLESLK